jgi:hypothetical protein
MSRYSLISSIDFLKSRRARSAFKSYLSSIPVNNMTVVRFYAINIYYLVALNFEELLDLSNYISIHWILIQYNNEAFSAPLEYGVLMPGCILQFKNHKYDISL